MCVGEAPGANEDKAGEPWVGAAGTKLRWLLAEAGIHSYVLANAVRHHPEKNRDPTPEEIENCRGWLQDDIDYYQPDILLALGRVARASIAEVRTSATVVHAIHPSATLRNTRYHETLVDQIHKVGAMLGATPIKTKVTFSPIPPAPPPRAELTLLQPDGLVVAADIETEGDENDGAMVGYSISDGVRKTWVPTDVGPIYWPYQHTIMHGATFDAPRLGIDLFTDSWDCTLLEAYVLRYPELGLKTLAPRLTGIPMTTYAQLMKQAGVRKGHSFRKALEAIPDEAVEYATTDSEATYHLHRVLSGDPRWNEGKLRWRYDNVEKPTAAILSEMQETGVLISTDRLAELSRKLTDIGAYHKAELDRLLGEDINVKSPRLGEILNARLGAGLDISDKGNVKADQRAILAMAHADAWDGDNGLQARGLAGALSDPRAIVAYHILAAREARTLDALFCQGLPRRADANNLIHCEWKQTVTLTNRLASGDPNLQNISARSELGKPIRQAFIVPEGFVWVRADFSQVEVRLFAHFTRDPMLLDCYPWDGEEKDVHDRVAKALGIARKPAKNGLFETIYGGGADKFARTVGIAPEKAGEFHEQLLRELPSIANWAKWTEDTLLQQGYLETILGHRMYFPTFWSPVRSERAEALRSAANSRIQGSAADIMKLFMIEAYKICKAHGAWFLVQVHDELGIACPAEEAPAVERELHRLVRELSEGLGLSVPLALSIGWASNWKDAG